jgi:hypothetical protein
MYLGSKPIVSFVSLKVPQGRSEEDLIKACSILGLNVYRRTKDDSQWIRIYPKEELSEQR